jgi:enamine deaminase RidA (YjgF/YER057c/UK114 family)
MSDIVDPQGWKRPQGYSNAVTARGELVFVAGQIGWNERQEFVSDDFAEQAAQALRNVVTVLREVGGTPQNVTRLTWFVTDKREYNAAKKRIGAAYREIFGKHYPAMTLVQVAALLEDRANLQIDATAVVPIST